MKLKTLLCALVLLLGCASHALAQVPQCAFEITELNAPDAAQYDQFGIAVSIDGDRAIVGSTGDQDGGLYSGSATLFRRVGMAWEYDSKLVAGNPDVLDQFGAAVLIAGDVAFVGAPGDDNAAGTDAGAVHVFEYILGAWLQTAKLVPDQPTSLFGSAIALEGNTLVVAAPFGYVAGISGAAYVFENVGGLWQLQERIVGDLSNNDTIFGMSVAVEGNIIAVGAGGIDETSAGIVRVYQRSGSSWPLQQTLSPTTLEAGDHFGASMAMDDQQLLVGAPGDDDFSTTVGKAFVFHRKNAQFEQEAELRPATGNPNDSFGSRVALDGNRALVAAVKSDSTALGTGSVTVFRRGLSIWTEVATLTASDSNAFGAYGWGLAIDGDTGLVGALAGNGGAVNSGSAYLIGIPTPEPVAQAHSKLLASVGEAGEEFGSHVAISGQRLIVAAPKHVNAGSTHSGEIHVLRDTQGDGNWTEEAILTPPDSSPTGQFGFNADIKSDVIVAGTFHDNASPGATYVFRNGPLGWQAESTLIPDDGANGDRFGFHVALCDNIAVVGSRDADLGATADNGAAYVFSRQDGEWNQRAKLTPDDAALVRGFGTSVALNCDTVLVGAPYVQAACQNDPQCPNSGGGSVYVFKQQNDAWVQTQTLTANDAQQGDGFGYWVAVSEKVAVVGAWLEDDGPNTNNGAAYIFREIDGIWQQEDKLGASDASSNANFGLRVAISGNAAVVPARRADGACPTDPDCDSGAAYLFHFNGTSWDPAGILTASDAAAGDWFGQDVAIEGKTVVVGSVQDDDLGESSGSAYLFDIVNDCATLAVAPAPSSCTPLADLILYGTFD